MSASSVVPKLDYQVPKPDDRDFVFQLSESDKNSSFVESANLRTFVLPINRVKSQGQRGSCTSFALTTAFENLIAVVTGDTSFQSSPLFNYTLSRILDSVKLSDDPGTTLRSACGNLRLSGAAQEVTWPYTDANFAQVPNAAAFEEASKLARLIDYFEVKRDLSITKYIFGNLRYFILIGFRVYPSYQTRQVYDTGDIPLPTEDEKRAGAIGGHACSIIGFDDTRQVYIIVNSYGTSWGRAGLGTIPYAYFEDEDLITEAKLMLPSDDFNSKYSEAQMKTAVPVKESGFNIKRILFIILCIIVLSAMVVLGYKFVPVNNILSSTKPPVYTVSG